MIRLAYYKYKNIPTVVDGNRFASRKEANHYSELCLLERAKEIRGFELQPKFKFPMGFSYIADFKVIHNDGSVEIVDVKGGFETPVFRLKKKCFEYFYPKLNLRIVK